MAEEFREPDAGEWAWLDALVGPLDDDFVETAMRRPTIQQERPALSYLFE